MREAAACALEMAAGRRRSELDGNIMLQMALTRCLEIPGEAASKISAEVRLAFPSIPFVKIVSMRNRLIHAYFDVDLNIVWTTVDEDLPPLLPALDSAIAQMDQ